MTDIKRYADEITIKWKPNTDDGNVIFQFTGYAVESDGTPTALIDPSKSKTKNYTIGEIASHVVNSGIVDPVTGETLPAVSGAGLMKIIKAVVNDIRSVVEEESRTTDYPPDPNTTTVVASQESSIVGNPVTVTIDLKNADGSDISWGGYSQIAVYLSDPTSDVTLIDNDDGTYTSEVNAKTAGTLTVTAENGGDVLGQVSITFNEE